jgi:hypothetical protein
VKLFLSFLLLGVPVFGQLFSAGVKAGVPFTEAFSARADVNPTFDYTYNIAQRRYIVGGTAELHLPFGFSVELDALYRRLGYDALFNSHATLLVQENTVANEWEFPLLLKYKLGGLGPVRPFLDAGPSYRHLSGLKQTITQTILYNHSLLSEQTGSPVELQASNSPGIAAGAGVAFKFLGLEVSPEIRFTHWGNTSFRGIYGREGFRSNRNATDFVLGLTF